MSTRRCKNGVPCNYYFRAKNIDAQIKYIFFSILRKSLNNSQIRAVIVFVKSASYALSRSDKVPVISINIIIIIIIMRSFSVLPSKTSLMT